MITPRDPWRHDAIGGVAPWLRAELEATAHQVAREWGIRLGPAFDLARFSFAAPADHDKVLKVVPAEDDEGDNEADALALWNGDGAVRLLRHDRRRRALLLSRAQPGFDARTLSEREATSVAAEIAPQLWKRITPGRPFRSVKDHIPRWLRRSGEHDLVPIARALYESMNVDDSWLIHGDFHHHNLLRDGERWVAIDPKPYAAEREFDVVTFLWNPAGHLASHDDLRERIRAFAAIGLDEERIRKWAIVRGTYLGLPLRREETDMTSPQLRVARLLLKDE